MSFRNKGGGLVLAVSALLSSAAYADNADNANQQGELRLAKANVLEEVVVSGSRVETALSQTPVAIGRVGNDDMQRDKPKTIGDVINRIAGVSWVDLGNEQHMMGIRQPNSTNSVYQYLEDGIPIRPLGVFNHNSLNELNMSGSDSVEVVKGPSSSLYGSNAVGGAINFLTSKPSLTPYASVGVRHEDTQGYTRYDTALSDTFGNFGIRFGQYSSRRDENNWQEYSYGKKDAATIRMDYALTDTSSLRSSFVYSNLDSAMTGSVFESDYFSNPGKSINTFTYRKDKTMRANVAWEGNTIPDGRTTVTAFWRKNDHGQTPSYTIRTCNNGPGGTLGTGFCGTINNNHVDSLGLDTKHVQEFSWANSRLIGGVYLDVSDNPYVSDNINVVRDSQFRYSSYTMASATSPVGVRDYQTHITNYAPFFQWESSPIESVRVVIGGRYDAIDYDFTNNLAPGASYGAPNEHRSFAHFSPKIGATYSLIEGVSIYVNISEGFTAPDVSQLYSKAAIPDLKPATYRNYEVGARATLLDGAIKLDSAIYRLDGEDTIVSFTPQVGNSTNQNAGQTRSQGFEFGATLAVDRIDARFGASLATHTFVKYEVGTVNGVLNVNYNGNEMPQAPNTFTAEIGVRPIQGLRLALEGIRQSAYWMNNANTVRYDGHTLLNVRGVFTFAKSWEAWLQGRNLTDELYSDSASSSYSGSIPQTQAQKDSQNQYTPGTPRTAMIGFTYTFGK